MIQPAHAQLIRALIDAGDKLAGAVEAAGEDHAEEVADLCALAKAAERLLEKHYIIDITQKQIEILEAILRYQIDNGNPPSYRELQRAVGINSISRIVDQLNVLEKRGYIGRTKKKRSLTVLRIPQYKNCGECGNVTTVAQGELRKGSTKSCGCVRARSGGMCNSTEYTTWQEMKRRCYNRKYREYYLYGGRGITICGQWRTSFVNFLADTDDDPCCSTPESRPGHD